MERVGRIVGLPDPAFIVRLGVQVALDNVALHFVHDHADRTGARYLRSNG